MLEEFNDITLNSSRWFEVEITKNANQKGFKTFIYLKKAVQVNDIFRIKRHSDVKYYVKQFIKLSNDGDYTYEIKRFDGNNITQVDLDRILKDRKIKIKGHLN